MIQGEIRQETSHGHQDFILAEIRCLNIFLALHEIDCKDHT